MLDLYPFCVYCSRREASMDKTRFSFEDLEVWQKSVNFASVIIVVIEKLNSRNKHFRLIEQLESASTSIALNIAEGKERYSPNKFYL
jgi:hypothetical protein